MEGWKSTVERGTAKGTIKESLAALSPSQLEDANMEKAVPPCWHSGSSLPALLHGANANGLDAEANLGWNSQYYVTPADIFVSGVVQLSDLTGDPSDNLSIVVGLEEDRDSSLMIESCFKDISALVKDRGAYKLPDEPSELGDTFLSLSDGLDNSSRAQPEEAICLSALCSS
ncbi:hypothetical protein NDU88_002737 [Pleurodeles waltl]|uniref:Uncharacterized protein n=1 Tax=Pleurodeles waltl TaxID=8319 RepID=A0AAV7SBD2_PLEWA|nr:hypothetical protein NDU88_002737 [Pleurodeles waltl]